tara:strand:- start:16657 stop:18207 length:1551 start_codon:yes stop_codon:yes gene_type:complete
MINIKENSFSDLLSIEKITDNEIITPFPVVKKMVELLPEEIFKNPNNKFIDISSKSGIYLKYIFFYLLEKLPNINIDKNNNELDYILDQDYDFKNKEDKKRFILKYMIYGIATSELSFLTSKRTLYENIVENEDTQKEGKILSKPIFDNKDGNIVYKKIKDNQYWFLEEKNEIILKELSKNIKFKKDKKMKFNVIIGNPPYQKSNESGKGSDKPIYHNFIEKSIQLSPDFLSFIVPSRWFSGTKELQKFRQKIYNDNRITKIYNFPNSEECFSNVNITSGVHYFLWENKKNNDNLIDFYQIKNNKIVNKVNKRKFNEFEIFITEEDIISILYKVKNKEDFFYNKVVSGQTPFGLHTSFRNYNKDCTDSANTKIYVSSNHNIPYGYINKNIISKNKNLIDKYKVFIGKSNGAALKNRNIISLPFLGEKNSACTQTFLVVDSFNDINKCNNLIKYIKTKFFRFLVSIKKQTQDNNREVFQYVPVLDMSKEWSDAELYERYNLTEDEINYIENSIKEME